MIQAAVGTGPVDASFKAIDAIVDVPNTLLEYSVHSVTEGINAVGEVTVRISPTEGERSFGGYGADDDVIVASVRAYLAALNRMMAVTGAGGLYARKVLSRRSKCRSAICIMVGEVSLHFLPLNFGIIWDSTWDKSRKGSMTETNSSSPRTLFEKVWNGHIVRPQTDDVPAVLYIDLHLVHEVTSPQAFTTLRERGLTVRRPDRTLATLDHSTPTTPRNAEGIIPVLDVQAAKQLDVMRQNCADFGIPLYDSRL